MARFGRSLAVMSAVSAIALAGCGAGRKAQWETNAAKAGAKPADAGMAASGGDAAAKAEEAWGNRGDKASLEAAIAAWEAASLANPNDAVVLAKLSHAYYFLADAHHRKLGDKSAEYLGAFEKGTAAGERALAAASPKFKQEVTGGIAVEQAIKSVGPEGLEAMYWYAANLGKWSRAKGFAVTLGNKDRIRAVMSRALELDPNFFHGAPYRYFGAFYAVAPGFAGGDMNKSKESFEKSLASAPNYVGTKVLFAELYAAKKGDRALYEKLLDEVLATPDDILPGLEPETRNEKEKAKELKAKAGDI